MNTEFHLLLQFSIGEKYTGFEQKNPEKPVCCPGDLRRSISVRKPVEKIFSTHHPIIYF
jgi:hypothetical protein